jgi:CHAD domain-containing protein
MKDDQAVYIIHYYFKRLNKYTGQLKKDLDEKTIHLFRVDVKKLRAFLRMMRSGAEEHDHLRFPRKFKKMYSLTGKIRDRQLCIKRIKENEHGKDHKVQNKIEVLEEELKKLAGKRDDLPGEKELMEIEKKMSERAYGIRINLLVKNFLSQKLDGIKKIITAGEYKDKELHSIRKNIKDIVYIVRIFRVDCKTPLPFSFWNEPGLKKAEDLAHALGLFNDACIALSFILPADIKRDNSGEKEHLLSIRRKWLEEKRILKKEILIRIQEIKLDLP